MWMMNLSSEIEVSIGYAATIGMAAIELDVMLSDRVSVLALFILLLDGCCGRHHRQSHY